MSQLSGELGKEHYRQRDQLAKEWQAEKRLGVFEEREGSY